MLKRNVDYEEADIVSARAGSKLQRGRRPFLPRHKYPFSGREIAQLRALETLEFYVEASVNGLVV